MHEGYLVFGGTEIANTARTAAYMHGTGSDTLIGPGACHCATIPQAVDDPDYIAPDVDPAPWYDPSDPRSAGFGGLWVEKIDGLTDSTMEREVSQRIGDGAVVSCPRYGSRTLTVTGWLFAQDECSAEYGRAWLNAALRGAACSDCTGNDLCLLVCCPVDAADTDNQLRTLKRAQALSGAKVLRKAASPNSRGCATGMRPIMQVEFQISTDPSFWRQPVEIVSELPWPEPTGDEECNITWRSDPDCDPARPGCAPGVNAALPGCPPDLNCPPPPPPPRLPMASSGCACIPLKAVRSCVEVPALDVPAWFDAALQFDLYAGESPLRNAMITVYPNPAQKPPEQLDECAALGVYYISSVPANSTLRIDGTTARAYMDCPGGVTSDATRNVYGTGGGPVEHITLSCGIPYTICLDADTEFVDPLAHATVRLVTRED